ncbi:proline-rich protein 36 isoform X4 [Diabrotica virgifera virgifera]|uniref:Proline-rich protein 36 isoform X3 n=1 Tax=Diabrotica virgifera virgifera TaxID=50390 RepID=A0A6P7F3R2_DIAVI|nr:proline-rich protein 36 isoform X4 [Diabrotica virgifera virgifera]
MVCKEEVLLWFKDLDSHNRIDLVYELLNMCLPFEVRFFGSCIEELGRLTYLELRGPSITANDLEKLSKDGSFTHGILDESVRHRLIIYMSLLSSNNCSVANWFYQNLLRTDSIDEYLKEKGKEEMLHNEFLLLFTMALHHPAFTYEQKQFFNKVLMSLIDIRENRVSAKHSALGYPPGFGYPTQKSMEIPVIPVKTAPTTCGDSPAIFHQPPGLSHLPPPPANFDFNNISMWNRPGFPYGAPEVSVPPFPAPTISPLVSQAASPSQSRSTSPHRTPIVRPPPPPPPGGIQLTPAEDKRDIMWPADLKPNGIRFPPIMGKMRPYLVEQIQAMNLEGENALHHSNSSSNSSPNETPPSTPSITPATTPHGPGRGGDANAKPRSNGMPPFGVSPGPPMPDTQSPPPFSNSTVPYSFQQPFTTLPPNRSMFHYNPAYRPTFTAQFPNPTFPPTDTNYPPFTVPYFPFVYSSQYPPRTPPGCYNCGAPNHVGSECTNQTIDEITQKKTYVLDYNLPLPDAEK